MTSRSDPSPAPGFTMRTIFPVCMAARVSSGWVARSSSPAGHIPVDRRLVQSRSKKFTSAPTLRVSRGTRAALVDLWLHVIISCSRDPAPPGPPPQPSPGGSMMPRLTPSRSVFPALAALLLVSACSGPPTGDFEHPDLLDAEDSARAEALGAPAAGALAQGLMSRLAEAMEQEGVAGAVSFCSDEAIPLTRTISRDHDPSLEIKRTTMRWRNPDNAPDEWEERMLRYLEAMEGIEPGSAPETVTAQGPDGSLRFYRTLRTAPMCLHCHGTDLDPEVRQVMEARYPEDRATGYGEGDFRGLIRVQIPGDAR
ncbi:MAG: DUF3365 domain-containing protein [Gemmatimonadales bacterium]|nr:MAG: DUF3365 domain-containing protein [Gemmatimonadales bacterium]